MSFLPALSLCAWFAIGLAPGGAIAAAGPAKSPRPSARIAVIGKAPRIDGRLTERFWQDTDPIANFVDVVTGAPARMSTFVGLATDDRWLYVAVRCETEDKKQLLALRRERDSDVAHDDSLEVLLDPAEPHGRVYRFVINSRGTRMDEVIASGGRDPGGARPVWVGQARMGERPVVNEWIAELAIDFASLGLTAKNSGLWRINFIRHARGATASDSAWSRPRFWAFGCDRERTGLLSTINTGQLAFGCRLRVLDVAIEPSDGNLRGRIRVEAWNDLAARRRFELRLRTPTRLVRERSLPLAGKARAVVEFDFELAAGEEPELKVEAIDTALNLPAAATAHVLRAPPLLTGAFDRSYYSSESRAEFEVRIGGGDPRKQALGLRLTNAQTGDTVWQSSSTLGPVRVPVAATIPLARLPMGGYLMETTLEDRSAGRRYRFWNALRRMPPQKGEFKADAQGFLRRDGQPFYPIEVRRVDLLSSAVLDMIEEQTAFNAVGGLDLVSGDIAGYFTQFYDATGCLGDLDISELYLSRDSQREVRIEQLRDLAALPSLFGYGVESAALDQGFSTAPMVMLQRYLQSLDPHRLFYIEIDDPRQARRYAGFSDFLMLRCGAIGPDSAGEPLWVYEQIRRAREAAGPAVPIVALLSAYEDRLAGLGRPTPRQMAAMAYLAMAAGAAGLVFDGFNAPPTAADPGFAADSRLLTMIRVLTQHAKLLGPILCTPDASGAIEAEQPPDGPVRWTARRHGGKLYLIAVNASAQNAYAAFRPKSGRFAKATEIFENRDRALERSRFSVEFGPFESHVFAIEEAR